MSNAHLHTLTPLATFSPAKLLYQPAIASLFLVPNLSFKLYLKSLLSEFKNPFSTTSIPIPKLLSAIVW